MVTGLARVPPPPPTHRRLSPFGLDLPAVAWRLLCAFTLSIPFSIFIAQLLLILTAAAGIADWWGRGRPPRLRTTLDAPMFSFLVVCLVAALHGLHPMESLWGCRTYLQMTIIYLVLGYADSEERCLALARWFLVGAVIAASYTVLSEVVPLRLPRLFLGRMTQSGQLLFAVSLSLPLLLGRVFPPARLRPALVLYVLALIINLKLGVWLGTFASVATIAWLASRRLMWTAAVIITLTVTLVAPVRSRITTRRRSPPPGQSLRYLARSGRCRASLSDGRRAQERRDLARLPEHSPAPQARAQYRVADHAGERLSRAGHVHVVDEPVRHSLVAFATAAADCRRRAVRARRRDFRELRGLPRGGARRVQFRRQRGARDLFRVMGLGLALERRIPHSG